MVNTFISIYIYTYVSIYLFCRSHVSTRPPPTWAIWVNKRGWLRIPCGPGHKLCRRACVWRERGAQQLSRALCGRWLIMMFQWVCKDSELRAHTRRPEDLARKPFCGGLTARRLGVLSLDFRARGGVQRVLFPKIAFEADRGPWFRQRSPCKAGRSLHLPPDAKDTRQASACSQHRQVPHLVQSFSKSGVLLGALRVDIPVFWRPFHRP